MLVLIEAFEVCIAAMHSIRSFLYTGTSPLTITPA